MYEIDLKILWWKFPYDDLSCELHACMSCKGDEGKHALQENVDYWTENANKNSIVYMIFMWWYMHDVAGLKLLILNERNKPPHAGHPSYQNVITTSGRNYFSPY